MQKFVTDVPTTAADTVIRVTVDYYKNRREVAAHAFPVVTESHSGVVFERVRLTMALDGWLPWEKMERRAPKRLAKIAAEVAAQVANRAGPAWELVLKIVRHEKMGLADAPQQQVAS